MPIYEYHCPTCDNTFERLLPMSQAEVSVSCPTCHNGAKRVLSVFASLSKSAQGTTTALGGGSCACGAGGACGCS